MSETTTPKKRGGPQPGSGRPTKDQGDKIVKCNVSMTKAHHEATEGDRAGIIRRALDMYLGKPDWKRAQSTFTKTVEVTTSNEPCEGITFVVKGYED